MSVTINQINFYGAANMPEVDGSTVGGAVDLTKKVAFSDVNSTMALDLVSSSASDTAVKIQVTGRDSTGVIQTPAAATLTGTTLIANAFSGQTFQRLLAGVITGGAIAGLSNPGGTAAVGDVAAIGHTRLIAGNTAQAGSANTSGTTPPIFKLKAGDGATVGGAVYNGLGLIIRITGGTGANQLRSIIAPYSAGAYGTDIVAVSRDWSVVPDATSVYDIGYGFLFDVLPNPVTAVTRLFATATADVAGGSTRYFYEKVFALNTNASTALLNGAVQVLSESPTLPTGVLIDLGLTTGLNDTATVTNRQTAPANPASFTTQPAAINIPASPGSLPNGNAASGAQACWLRMTVPAGAATYSGAVQMQVTGSTV